MNKVKIGQKSKVNIKWNVLPIDYSRDAEDSIIIKFSNKYSIPRNNINVEPVFVQMNTDGTTIPITNSITKSIQDKEFQRELFKKFIEERGIENYDYEKLLEIDDLINSKIDYELYDSNKKYSIKWIKWSNFMSYGENNYFDFTTLKGLVLLTSEPANQGGKSTFCLDLFRFLLFGKVTSRENDWTLSKVFNKHLPEATEVVVEGCVVIDGQEYVIKRTITRPSLKKRTDKSKVVQKLNYYRLANGELVDLEDVDNAEETTTTLTNKVIKEAIGNERDFDLMICVDSDNLKDLISLKDADRGRLITRWIGLLPLEDKDKIAREFYNKSVVPSLLMNRYNIEDLKTQITSMNEENEEFAKTKKDLSEKLEASNKKLEGYNSTKETLLSSKTKIDDSLTHIDVKTIENTLEQITEKGKRKKIEREENKKKLSEIKCTEFNETHFREVEDNCTEKNGELAVMRNELSHLKKDIELLKNSEFCPTCGAKLKNVDNTEAIKDKESDYNKLVEAGKKKKEEYDLLVKEKDTLKSQRDEYNEGIRLKLIIEKNDVDIDNLVSSYKENKRKLKDIEDNKTAIENNNKIDTSLNIVNANILNETRYIKSLENGVIEAEGNIKNNEKIIKQYSDIISTLEKEAVFVHNWKIYLDMIGKNGISKLVLRNTLPLINGELKRLLNGVCDFYVEVSIDDHNDVMFNMVHDGVSSSLGSGSGFEKTVASLALRSVLSRISTFSKPSFVVFDEILGGVADVNYDQVKLLYDKIVKDYDFIFQITHLKQIADWHNTNIIVKKKNNISEIESA